MELLAGEPDYVVDVVSILMGKLCVTQHLKTRPRANRVVDSPLTSQKFIGILAYITSMSGWFLCSTQVK